MDNKQGFYTLVQYSEVPERAEFVNIGVILFAGAPNYVLSKFNDQPRRAQKVFGINPGKHFQLLQISLRDRLASEFGKGWSRDAIQKFVSMRSGKVRLTSPRSVLAANAIDILDELFEDLVGETPVGKRRPRANTRLAKAFRDQGVERLLSRPNPIELNGGIRIQAPYGYQNGTYNLINAVSLAGDADETLSRVSPFMIEGEMLFEATRLAHRKKLVVIGDDSDGADSSFVDMISNQMSRHSVGFFTLSKLDPLVRDIRKNFAAHN